VQKYKFGVTFHGALLLDSLLDPPEDHKKYVDVSWPERIGMHNVTHRSHQMQQYKFGIMFPGAFFVKYVLVPLSMTNGASMFHGPDAPEYTT
jgi:hypothetical protein